jgi:hypothetical protein
MARNLDFYLKWTATAIIVLATLANAFDVVPLNKILFLLGSCMWTAVGLLWKQPSLWTLNLFCVTVYIIGLLYH